MTGAIQKLIKISAYDRPSVASDAAAELKVLRDAERDRDVLRAKLAERDQLDKALREACLLSMSDPDNEALIEHYANGLRVWLLRGLEGGEAALAQAAIARAVKGGGG